MPQRITPPPDASINVQRAIQDLDRNDQETNSALEKAALKINVDQQIADLQSQIDILKRGGSLDPIDVFRGGDAHYFGHVPDPGPTSATGGHVLREDGTWGPVLDGIVESVPAGKLGTSPDQRILNVKGSLAVLNAISAETLISRRARIQQVGCFVSHSTTQSIGNAAWQALVYNTSVFDSGGMHSVASNTSRLVAPQDGWYSVGYSFYFEINSTAIRIHGLIANNNAASTQPDRNAYASWVPAASGYATCLGNWFIKLSAGDYVEVYAYQNSGGALNVMNTSSAVSCYAWMYLTGV